MYGQKLEYIRNLHGLTQEQLGDKLEVHRSTIGFWERSIYPPLEGIIKVCEFIKIPVFEFFATEQELKKYLPSWITQDQLDSLKMLDDLPVEIQKHLLVSFKSLLAGCIEIVRKFNEK